MQGQLINLIFQISSCSLVRLLNEIIFISSTEAPMHSDKNIKRRITHLNRCHEGVIIFTILVTVIIDIDTVSKVFYVKKTDCNMVLLFVRFLKNSSFDIFVIKFSL